jgi:tRNA(Arg) A34 adenosine deaminase TadA
MIMTQEDSEAARFMRHAIALAYQGMAGGHGGPFGAVIVKDGEIVGQGHNRVLSSIDPTAHAEVTAIRDACKNLRRFDLSDCEIYVNGMPCPMCMSAIFWSRVRKVHYGAPAKDAEAIGFDDAEFYRQLALPAEQRSVPAVMVTECYDETLACFKSWADNESRIPY